LANAIAKPSVICEFQKKNYGGDTPDRIHDGDLPTDPGRGNFREGRERGQREEEGKEEKG